MVLGLMMTRYQHPYSTEIEQHSYPKSVRTVADPLAFWQPTDHEAIFVDTMEGVESMLAELRIASEIAIDLEHHDTHSYVGIVCLMQISTRQKDWIVDTLVPWREDLQILNEVFANPNILKVLQGSTMDMIWLQRDLGLYIVGLFDTFHASTALGFPQKSLKYLLERFCGFHANKKYQMADWRVRPIPQEMLDYARSDTHYLLFIYDNLRNMLLEASTPDNNLVDYVQEQSKKEALQRYERAVYDSEKGLGSVGWFAALARRSTRFTPEQFGVYRAVHEWRDRTAREQDESVIFVMSQATLFAVAEAMPTTVPALIGVTNPVSKAINKGSRGLVEIIKKAKDAGREGPTVAEMMRENEAFLPRKKTFRKLPERAEQDQGLGATLQMLTENGDVGSSAERAATSLFWGPLVTGASQFVAPFAEALRLVLPLPAASHVSLTSSAQPTAPLQVAEPSSVAPSQANGNMETAVADNAFVLKNVGRKSKRKAEDAVQDDADNASSPTNGIDTNADYSPLGNPLAIDEAARAEIKARSREQKRQKKALREAERSGDALTEPFDYANAESVLHAKPDKQRFNGKSEGQRPFNPYAKALNGPQGLKRAQKETAGKSFTFKK
jgi:exosome complex exonuclease RRP6